MATQPSESPAVIVNESGIYVRHSLLRFENGSNDASPTAKRSTTCGAIAADPDQSCTRRGTLFAFSTSWFSLLCLHVDGCILNVGRRITCDTKMLRRESAGVKLTTFVFEKQDCRLAKSRVKASALWDSPCFRAKTNVLKVPATPTLACEVDQMVQLIESERF